MAQQNFSGQTFGQYELREVLGTGGMGTVYRAYQQALRRAVAVKVLPATLAEDPDFVERFHREAETAAALEHPHIIPVYDYGVQDGHSFIVMRLLPGGALSDRLPSGSKPQDDLVLPSLGEIATLLNQLAGAFDYAHAHGIIHRDIKPSNIMFDNQGNAFLVDFGIAKLLEHTHHLTATGAVLGTPYYMAPEQWRTEDIAPATDQYALAVTVYQLLTGRVPFQSATPFGLMHKHINETPAPPHLERAEAPEEVSIVLDRAMAKTPGERFPTVTAFAQAFERASSPQPGQATGFFAVSPDEMTYVPSPGTPLPPLSQTETKESDGTAPSPATPPETVLDTPPVTRPFYRRPAVGGGVIVLLAVIAAIAAVVLLSQDGNGDTGAPPLAEATTPAPPPSQAILTETPLVALQPTEAITELPTEAASITPTGEPTGSPPAVVLVPTTAQPFPTATLEPTAASTETPQPSRTPTEEPTGELSDASSGEPTAIPPVIVLASATPTATPTSTPTATPTATATPDIEATAAARLNQHMTETAAAWTDTPTPDLEATIEALAIAAMTRTAESWTVTPTPTVTASPTLEPPPTATATATATVTFSATPTLTVTPSPTATATPTARPSATPTPTMVFSPTATLFGGGLSEIVFVSERDGNREIYRANADGTNVTRLTNHSGEDWDPVWSPDGSQIAFHSLRDGNAEIYVMSADGSNLYNLSNAPNSTEYHPVWSPDGTQILFYTDRDGNGELYMMNADGSSPRNLTRNAAPDGGGSWSPDGNWIVFVSERSGATSGDIYVMDARGGSVTRLTTDSANDAWPAWSPDGRQIAFASNRTGNLQVYTMDTNGGNVTRLTATSAEEWWPAWSADGNYLLYTTTRDGIGSVYLMNADGSSPRALTGASAWDFSAHWRPAPDGPALAAPAVVFASPVPAPTSAFDCALQFAAVINIRTGPGTGYGVLGASSVGVNLPVDGRSTDGSWWRVQVDGQSGWVAGTLASVETVGGCDAVPVVS